MAGNRDADFTTLVEELEEASAQLQAALRANTRNFRRLARDMGKGTECRVALGRIGVDEARLTLNEALRRFEEARHRVRAQTIASGIREGMSVGEIARVFGFSRQLAQRYVQEMARETNGHSASRP